MTSNFTSPVIQNKAIFIYKCFCEKSFKYNSNTLQIMTKINKKIQQEYFEAVSEGKKRFEVRLANFECKPGDILVLQEQ